jgi:membrane-associated phospholipid phosphatase
MILLTAIFCDVLQTLDGWDKQVFVWINDGTSNAFFDWLFPWWRARNTWFACYIFRLLFIFFRFGWKAWPWILFAAAAPALGDLLSSWAIKPWFNRLRPCNESTLQAVMHLRVSYCPANGSFTSSHAVNHFALATFFFFSLRKHIKAWAWLFLLWAATICYGQVYVGVHYPGDVICGAILGALIGLLLAKIFNRKIKLSARK